MATPMGVLDLGILPSGLCGWNIVHSGRSSKIVSSSRRLMVEKWGSKNSTCASCGTEGSSFSRVGSQVNVGLGRRKNLGLCCRQWRIRAMEDGEENPLGQEGYWEGAEGKQQLNEIEEMLELIEEAENLRKAESAESGPGELTSEELKKQRAEKLREELARRAKQQAEQRKQAEVMFSMGQRAYGRGVYDKSVELLEAALTNVPGSSHLGGDIQIWLAMAYEAHNRHGDCISLYKRLEASHPNKQIRRQAANLRYILEAPKLKISKEEMVSIPIIERDYDRGSKTWSQRIRDRRRKPMPKSKTKDYLEDWLVWDPPRWERNPYFWVAFTVWLTLVGVSLMFQD
ncbi:unnamed protein product [Calypogeia fissa]